MASDRLDFTGTTGTGLDQLVEIITADPGLNYKLEESEILEGAQAADGMNQIIVEGLHATGLVNDGELNAADVRDLSSWIQSNYGAQWKALHGDDEGDAETGFHLVQNDGAKTHLFGSYNAVNTIADGIYHLGFGIDKCGRLLNEDGDANASVENVAYWLSDLLEADLAAGSMTNDQVDPYKVTYTDTGLDQLVDIIAEDAGLNQRVSTSEIMEGANAAADMNAIIVEAIRKTGLANDGDLNSADVRDLNAYIREHYRDEWAELHGDDEGSAETGFHLVQNDGASSRLYGTNAVNNVADGLYHMGFKIDGCRFLNEDGNGNVSLEKAAHWLNQLLEEDLESGKLANADVDPYVEGSTGTGLDQLVDIITEDAGLAYRISSSEIQAGAQAADDMNHLILESITETGVANDGRISAVDVRDMNDWIRDNRADEWAKLHGDDEGDVETGFHLVQNDGAKTHLFGSHNAVNTVADGIYHLGFGIEKGRLLNEDGDRNVSLETAADWLDELLEGDLVSGALNNPEFGNVDVAALTSGAIYSLDTLEVNGKGDQLELGHDAAWELSNGTISFSFVADEPEGWDRDTLFSKDAKYNGEGGHLGAWVRNGGVEVRFQSEDGEIYLKSGAGTVEAGQEYDFAFSFGEEGAHLYLDGVKVDAEHDFTVNLASNTEGLTLGANTWCRTDSNPEWRSDYFDGTIENFLIFDQALSNWEVYAMNGHEELAPFKAVDTFNPIFEIQPDDLII